MTNEVLTAVPLFLFMGYIVERANIVSRLFGTLNVAARRVPGSMAVAALITCTLFATATGIVGPVVPLMGLLAYPAMLNARYNVSFASGIICACGCIGILLPPSRSEERRGGHELVITCSSRWSPHHETTNQSKVI